MSIEQQEPQAISRQAGKERFRPAGYSALFGQRRMNPDGVAQTARGGIEYAQSGEGPAVLALHGAMGGYDQSDLLARTVGGPGFQYFLLSRPGYLGTPLSVGKSPEEQADAYAAFLDAMEIPAAAVMAISGGGPSAIHFALRHRDRCKALILISTCGVKVEARLPMAYHVLKLLARWPAFMTWMRGKKGMDLEQNLRRSIKDPEMLARVLEDAEIRPLLEELTAMGFDRVEQRLSGTFNDVDVTRSYNYPLEQIAVPTLVVHGTKDPLVPFEQHGKTLATRIPNAQLLAVEGGEHVAIFTHRDQVRAAATRFLRDHASS